MKHFRKIYADCEFEQKTEYGGVQTDHSAALVGAQLCFHLRCHQRAAEKVLGAELKRSAMTNWRIQVADLYLRSFRKRFQNELPRQRVIHADETVMQVFKERESRPPRNRGCGCMRPQSVQASSCAALNAGRAEAKAVSEDSPDGFSDVLITDG